MSFTWFADKPLRTREQVAAEIHQVSLARGLDQLATVLTCMAVDIEVGANDKNGNPQWWCPANPTNYSPSMQFPHDSLSNDNRSSGYLQQQPGPPPAFAPWWGTAENMMTLDQAANTFQDRLADDYAKAAGNAHVAGQLVQAVQGSEFPDRYQEAWDTANDVVTRALATSTPVVASPPPVTVPVVATNSPAAKPEFNEYPLWSPNQQSRNGTTIDLWLWHTEEGHFGDFNAANDLTTGELDNPSSQVSYHYAASQDASKKVTVIDVLDTDVASWSVLSANNRSIDFCIAGSSVNLTRQQWFDQFGETIDVGCYISAQDCIKYPSLLVNGHPYVIEPDPANTNLYHKAPPGISDHKYVTQFLKDGTHSDMGPNFPWDYVDSRTQYWFNVLKGVSAPVVAPPPGGIVAGNPYQSDTRTDKGNYSALTYSQLAGPLDADGNGTGWPQLGGLSVVDFLAELGKKVDGVASASISAAATAAVRSTARPSGHRPEIS